MRVCPICGQYKLCNKHHRWVKSVWGDNNDIIWLCLDCHQKLHDEIREKENLILRQYPDIYIGTLENAINRRKIYQRNQNDPRRNPKQNARRT